jgi:23S rRNA (uracil1939-C5)-methyltransferase
VTHPTQTLEHVRAEGPDVETACLTLDRFGTLGDTVAEFEGREVSVFGGIPGERVVCRIVRYRRRRKAVVSGIVTDVLEPSPHRIAPPCPYFGPCSGCQWQHIDYAHQLDLKREAVRQAVDEYDSLRGTEVGETMPSEEVLGYRNHARFTVRRSGSLGFVNRITRRFVKIDECLLMAPGINKLLARLQGRSGATSQLSIRYGVNSGEWLIQPRLSINEVGLEAGQSHYTERLLGRSFRIGSPSFFQVNTEQAERMFELVRSRLSLGRESVLVDAFAGVGTFAALMAPHAGRVVAIEDSSAAIRDAAVNAEGLDNVELVEGRTEEVLSSMEETPDAVILDPPRAGCHADALEALARLAPPRVVYVSCDPVTLARDLDVMVGTGYVVESLEPVDMFPQTHHVECVATLRYGGQVGVVE